MICGSVCSGIGAPEEAWKSLGWRFAFASEIEKFPIAVHKARHPDIPMHGDFTTIKANDYEPIDLLIGGTPCQSFSIAGLRGGLDDDRGNLAHEFLRLAQRKSPKWLVWENVPGVLSSDGGRDFGSILGGMVELGYGIAYRILDAQYFGVPQRRRRVFVVGYLGDWRRAAAVLFERESMSGNPPPSRKTGEDITGTLDAGIGRRRGSGMNPNQIAAVYGGGQTSGPRYVAATLAAHGNRQDFDVENFVVGCPTIGIDEECNASIEHFGPLLRGGQGGTRQAVAYSIMPMNSGKDYKARETDVSQPIMAGGPVGGNQGGDYIMGFAQNQRNEVRTMEVAGALAAEPGMKQQTYLQQNMAVRRLTPRECERLQGFPDDYTQIEWRGKDAENCPDGPRYKALGNSMAVPVMRWIGERIQQVENLPVNDKEILK